MKLIFDKFVVFVPRGQSKLLKRQNKKKTYVVQSPGDDFSLFRKIKRKFRRTPHTNTYFFEGFYKAAKYLGMNSFWIENQKQLEEIADSKTLVLCEGSFIPDLEKNLNCHYVLHSIPNEKYDQYLNLSQQKKCLHLDLFKNKALEFTKINDLTFFDEDNFTLYQPWAGNLLPNEIIDNDDTYKVNQQYSYYIGMLYDKGIGKAKDINKYLREGKNQTQIKCVTGVSHQSTKELTLKSSICIDIREDHHLEIGYVPCRVFKTLSYGREIYVNSKYIYEYLRHIPLVRFYESGEQLKSQYDELCSTSNFRNRTLAENRKHTMNFLRENHTFVNRLENIIKVFS